MDTTSKQLPEKLDRIKKWWYEETRTFEQFIYFFDQELATLQEKHERELAETLRKLTLTDDRIYNYYDVEPDKEVADKMTGAYNAALEDVYQALTQNKTKEQE